MGRGKHDVYLSHPGATKRIFVDYIYSSFSASGISVFLDQHSLEFGRTQEDMRTAVQECYVGESWTQLLIHYSNNDSLSSHLSCPECVRCAGVIYRVCDHQMGDGGASVVPGKPG